MLPIETWVVWVVLGVLLLQSGWIGCVSDGKRSKPTVSTDFRGGPVQEINLLAIPVALNFDQIPGPDGFVVKVYASASKRPKPVAIENGKLEILMFDGIPDADGVASLQPMRIWSFTAEDLKPYEIRSSIGIGYQLAPVWGATVPKSDKFSVVVRYISPQGRTVASDPSIISIGIR